MDEATWDDGVKTPPVDWKMSAALENVPRGEEELVEVTSLERAVGEWAALDEEHRVAATLTPERPVLIDGISHDSFSGEGIAALAALLPVRPANEE